MPRTAALAAAASRGFGEFTSALTLTTVTFTSSTTWVAPSYVSNLVQMVGRGANATSDDYSTDTSGATLYTVTNDGVVTNITTTHDWSELYDNLQAWIAVVNSGGSGRGGPIGRSFGNGYRIRTNNTYQSYTNPPTPGSGGFAEQYFQIGTGANASSFSVPSSGTITYANTPSPIGTIGISFKPVYLGGDGAASTGVGKTFPGGTYDFPTGTGGPAPTTTFTNVTVTPSSSYSIVVPSGGQIAISYYAPT